MVFSPELFRKVGGFKEVSGGEDTEFGIAAARSGYEHHFLDDFSVATIERFSDRTTTGQ